MMLTTVISFYTPDWDYPEYAKQLQEDCDRLGLVHYIVEKPSEHDYVKNCNLKPFFIRDALQTIKGPVLWIDADGGIVSQPTLLLNDSIKDFDIAGNRSVRNRERVHVGSLWFNYTEATLEFVNAWCDSVAGSIDDAVFNLLWQEFSDKIKFYELPPEYFVVLQGQKYPVPDNSCIVHRLSNSPLKIEYKNNCRNA